MPWMESKFSSECQECGCDILRGDKIYYNGKAYCESCGEKEASDDKKNKPSKGPLTY